MRDVFPSVSADVTEARIERLSIHLVSIQHLKLAITAMLRTVGNRVTGTRAEEPVVHHAFAVLLLDQSRIALLLF